MVQRRDGCLGTSQTVLDLTNATPTQHVQPRRRALGCVIMCTLEELPRGRVQGDEVAYDRQAFQWQVRPYAANGAASSWAS